jgi:hypothetical protein
MSFEVGQRVVCVDNRPRVDASGRRSGHGDEVLPRQGAVYTVREIVPGRPYGYEHDGLLLEEIVNAVRQYLAPSGLVRAELFFAAWRFRPVRSTNIDVFTRMLAPAPSPAPAREPEPVA